MKANRLLEVCVDTIKGARIAAENGADRIELCAALSEGGLTPSSGMMSAASGLSVPVYAMIRPRSGDFRYSDVEKELMLKDIRAAEQNGMKGVVIGSVTDADRLDTAFLKPALQGTALNATLHRAFDTLSDFKTAIDDAVSVGFERVLTSGHQNTADEGCTVIREAVRYATGRISIMAGSGVTPANAARILKETGVEELHASCSMRQCALPASREVQLGFASATGQKLTDARLVRALRQAVDVR
ncbi:copper homeostasis protein CutC [Roseibium sp. HPY-6]|uniref:copper homeostasis protein CutC n=1 Tax=Roseibium sp. HPY-6 TaxID=3229852 RepID=UPI00338EA172